MIAFDKYDSFPLNATQAAFAAKTQKACKQVAVRRYSFRIMADNVDCNDRPWTRSSVIETFSSTMRAVGEIL
jgi:hypothetical protein